MTTSRLRKRHLLFSKYLAYDLLRCGIYGVERLPAGRIHEGVVDEQLSVLDGGLHGGGL